MSKRAAPRAGVVIATMTAAGKALFRPALAPPARAALSAGFAVMTGDTHPWCRHSASTHRSRTGDRRADAGSGGRWPDRVGTADDGDAVGDAEWQVGDSGHSHVDQQRATVLGVWPNPAPTSRRWENSDVPCTAALAWI